MREGAEIETSILCEELSATSAFTSLVTIDNVLKALRPRFPFCGNGFSGTFKVDRALPKATFHSLFGLIAIGRIDGLEMRFQEG